MHAQDGVVFVARVVSSRDLWCSDSARTYSQGVLQVESHLDANTVKIDKHYLARYEVSFTARGSYPVHNPIIKYSTVKDIAVRNRGTVRFRKDKG